MNWRKCKDNAIFQFFFLLAIGMILACIALCSKAEAKCLIHVVKRGETLAKIAKIHTGNMKKWKEIKSQNNLRTSRLKVGQRLLIYIPDEEDWQAACRTIINTRLIQLGLDRPGSFTLGIVHGVASASDNVLNLSPKEKVAMCRYALTTAIQESYCQFAIGGAGELGQYQFKANTVRLTGDVYEIKKISHATDADIARWMLDPYLSTIIFVLHFRHLHKRYRGLWMAWKRYNNGSEASAYASRALERYNKVKRINPTVWMVCEEGEDPITIWR